MPIREFYNVFHGNAMHGLVPVYFFFTGLAAGVFIVSGFLEFWGGDRFEKMRRTGAYLAMPLLAVGLLFLLLDLGRPFMFWRIITSFAPSSVAYWGVWLMSLFLLITLLYLLSTRRGNVGRRRIFARIGLPFAVLVALYSGVALMQMRAHTLWHSALIPVLFLVSAVVSGLALLMLFAVGSGVDQEAVAKARKFLAWLITVDLVLVVTEMLALLTGAPESVETAAVLLGGAFAPAFLGLYMILGLVVPLVLIGRKQTSPRTLAIASMLVLIGVFAMRFTVVMAGQHFPLS